MKCEFKVKVQSLKEVKGRGGGERQTDVRLVGKVMLKARDCLLRSLLREYITLVAVVAKFLIENIHCTSLQCN